ncbi:MAG: amidohydrolase family protein, partial [Candidatus Bipolaricaulota bacterium]
MHEIVIRGGSVVTPDGTKAIDVGIDDERIVALASGLSGRREVDAVGCYVLPGIIDAHTHMQLPVGGTRSSDDFESGSIAGAIGGVTCFVDFSVGAEDGALPEEIESRIGDASGSAVDFSLHAEIIGWRSDRSPEVAEAVALGVRSFKFYLAYSESGRMTTDAQLVDAFRALATHGGRAMVHAENDGLIRALTAESLAAGRTDIDALADTRPAVCEEEAILRASVWARAADLPLRIAHISSALGLRAATTSRSLGPRLVAESCPQYLLLDRSVYGRPNGIQFAATPPLRAPEDGDALWQAAADGTLDVIATDHCSFRSEQKPTESAFVDVPKGIPGIETLLPLLFSEGVGR